MWYSTSSGRIELNIPKRIADNCSHPGPCDSDVLTAMEIPSIARQLKKIDPKTLANELKEYGAWDEEELKNHNDKLMRLVWIACGDISEGIN